MALGKNNTIPVNKKLEAQIVSEIGILKDFDPDKKLKSEFELASLKDLQNQLDPEDVS